MTFIDYYLIIVNKLSNEKILYHQKWFIMTDIGKQNTYRIKINNKYYKTNHIRYSKLKYKYPSKPVDKKQYGIGVFCAKIFGRNFFTPQVITTWGIPKFSRKRVRNRSDFCQPFLTKIDTILGQLGPINLSKIGQIFVLQFPKNRSNYCQPPHPDNCRKVPIMGHTLRRDAVPPGLLRSPTRSCARWCPTIFNDYGLWIVLQPKVK